MVQVLDKNFLEKLLGQKISSLKFSQGSKKGDNVAGALTTITVETATGEVLPIIFKFIPPNDPTAFSFLVNFRIMEVEGEFYGPILEILRKLAQPKNIPLPFAKCYFTSDMYIALEDLRPQGFRMADKYMGLNLQEASMVLSSLGSFHALTYALLLTEGENQFFHKNPIRKLLLDFPWKPQKIGEGYLKVIGLFRDTIPVLEEKNSTLARKLEKLLPNFYQLFDGIWAQTGEKYFPVICHGDFWINNFLFKYNESTGEAVEVKFIDLQQIHRGNIFEELIYFFLTSTTPKFRETNLKPSLEAYYNGFLETLAKFEIPTPKDFSFEFLMENYRSNLKTMAVYAGGAIAFQLGSSEEVQTKSSRDTEDNILEEAQTKSANQNEVKILEDAQTPSTVKSEDIILRRFKEEELSPPESAYDDLGLFCQTNLRGDARAVERFVDVITELDELGVFDD